MDDEQRSGARPGEPAAADEPGGAGVRTGGVRVWQIVMGVIVVLALAVAIGVAVGRRGATNDQVSTATTGVTSPAPDTTGGAAVPQPGFTAPELMAVRDLDGFLGAAARADQALTEAANRINAASTETDIVIDQQTADLLRQVDLEQLARWLPPGMPDALQNQALLVYSDLVSRWGSLAGGQCRQEVGTYPRSQAEASLCFVNGAPAAARFDADFVTLERLAETTPAFSVADRGSRAAEELAVRVRSIDLRNLGCDSTGGFVATEPIVIVWGEIPGFDDQPPWQGTVDGIAFRGTFDEVRGWTILVNAC